MKNAALYVRVSTEKQVLGGYSISAQKNNLIKFAHVNNLNVYDIYSDEGISGKNISDRPEINRLINDIKEYKIDIVLLQKFDRLTRNVSDTEEFIDLFLKYDVDVWTISDGKVDISNSSGKFMTLLKGLFAQHEREIISERIKIAFSEKAKQGYTLSNGCPPYGYDRIKGNKVLKINSEEAKIVKKIYELFRLDYSYSEIARLLNNEKVKTKKSYSGKYLGIWTSKTVKLILTNPVYIGYVRYGIGRCDYYEGSGFHDSIISLDEWNKVQNKIVNHNKITKTKRSLDDAYYYGKLVCNKCNKYLKIVRNVRVNKNNEKVNYVFYRCSLGCNKSISHKKIDKMFIDIFKNKNDKLNRVFLYKNGEVINNINKCNSKLKNIIDLYLYDKIDYNQFDKMNNELLMLIKSYQKQFNLLLDQNDSKDTINNWNKLSDNYKKLFIDNNVDKIFVNFDDGNIIDINYK